MIEPIKSIFSLVAKSLDFIERYLLILAYLVIPILILAQVLSRYLMTTAVIGIEEGCLLIVAYVYYIGAAHALKTKSHITVKALHLFPITPKIRKIISCVATVFGFICATIISWYIVKYFLFVSKSPAMFTPFHFRKVYYVAGPAIGWTLIFVYSVVDVINMFKKDDEVEAE